jgi:hypothetical protein
MPAFTDGRPSRAQLGVAAAIMAMTVLLSWPTTRFVAVDFVVSAQRVPLWKKAIEFVERDAELRRLSAEALGAVDGDEAKAAAALAWTRQRVRYSPDGLPVLDDHISWVIARGYGEADQQADVFTTLLAYAGVRAFSFPIGTSPDVLPLAYVAIDGAWRVFDVTRGLTFRTAAGALATPDDIVRDPAIVERHARAAGVADVEHYLWYFGGYRPPQPPPILRAELQMPWRRLAFELRNAVGTP